MTGKQVALAHLYREITRGATNDDISELVTQAREAGNTTEEINSVFQTLRNMNPFSHLEAGEEEEFPE